MLRRQSGWFTDGLPRLLSREKFRTAATTIANTMDTLVTGSGQLEMRLAEWRPMQGRWAVVVLRLLQWVERGQLTERSVSEPVVEVVCEKVSTKLSTNISKTHRGLNFEQRTANTGTGKQIRARSLSVAVATRL